MKKNMWLLGIALLGLGALAVGCKKAEEPMAPPAAEEVQPPAAEQMPAAPETEAPKN